MANKNDEIDERFAKIYQDPRFRTIRKKDKVLKIDKRFKSMFTDDKFTLKYSMDKRGRPQKHLMTDDYKKFYRLEDEKDEKIMKENEKKEKLNKIDQNNECKEYIEPKLAHRFGYHRGLNSDKDSDDEGKNENDISSSSSSESEDDDDEKDEELEHNWAELDKDAKQIDHATSRIAICNVDWDRMNAQDLYILLNSFKRKTGTIHSIKIYYSKFGEERLQVEERKGPSEFIFGKGHTISKINDDDINDNDDDDDDEQIILNDDDDNEDDNDYDDDKRIKNRNTVEKLRKYQLERLKYYYAVVECDSIETAEIIYNELDGLEYESSSTMLDIRFIPDDMNFDDVKLKEQCTMMPTISSYKAPTFTNTALQHSNVKITWDENDPRRKEALNKAFEEDNEDDIKIYLASSSDDDDDDDQDDNKKINLNKIQIDNDMNENDKIDKYKNLLLSIEKENDKNNFDMEVTWDTKINTDNINKNNNDDDDDDDEQEFKIENNKNINKYNKKRRKNNFIEENNHHDDGSNELELLMMDMDNGVNNGQKRKHFNYKNIVEKYNETIKNKNKNNNQNDDDDDDGFKFNADDDRFKSIYESHLYNIDQSNPNFKRTKAFEQIIAKQKKRANFLIENLN